jgi:hypothetical protein
MKRLYFCLLTSFTLIFCSASSMAQEQVPLRPDWLASDYKSIELISLLASPAPLTPQRIRDILRLEDEGEDQDLGFGASTFDIARGHGYTTLYVEGVVFKGTIGFYKLGIRGSSESWPRIREHIIDLWKQNHGPAFSESETGLVHEVTNDSVLLRYKSAVSAELGEMKQADVPDELKRAFDYLTSPMANRAFGDSIGETAIKALIHAKRVDLIENVLRGFNPGGRIYAALTLLKLSKSGGLVLSPQTISTIAKVSNLDISIRTVRGCIVSYRTANEILSESEESEPPLQQI